jgi:TorA maturation chaperone TorD
MGQKMRCGSQLIDSYINDRIRDMRRAAKSAFYDSPKRAKCRRLKAADEKRAHDAREWEAARAEKQMLDNLADRLKGSE